MYLTIIVKAMGNKNDINRYKAAWLQEYVSDFSHLIGKRP
jgi:hypothetical protein